MQVPNVQRNHGMYEYNLTQDKKVSKVSSEKQLILAETAQESSPEKYSDRELTYKSKSAYKYDRDIEKLKEL